MQVKQHDQADDHPYIKDEIDAASDPNQFRKPGGMGRDPHEVEPGQRRDHRQYTDNRCASVFNPCV